MFDFRRRDDKTANFKRAEQGPTVHQHKLTASDHRLVEELLSAAHSAHARAAPKRCRTKTLQSASGANGAQCEYRENIESQTKWFVFANSRSKIDYSGKSP